MADKFPSLDTIDKDLPVDGDASNELDSDFLSREKQLIGDEFQTEQDKEILGEDDDEINNFKDNFPEVDNAEPEAVSGAGDGEYDEFEGFNSARDNANDKFTGESSHINEWKQRRELEISERESANSKRKEEIVSKAQQTIDDFYDNYNSKKDDHKQEILQEQETFLEKRDDFLKRGTLWDRVNELVDEVGALPSDDTRDKTRFKELLKKLKGKENVPGAAGY